MNPYTTTIALSNPKFDIIDAGIRQSYPNSCILWIEEINNPMLNEEYIKQKSSIENTRGCECKEIHNVYHGTNEQSSAQIIQYGFDPIYNKRNAYGIGSYFAKHASYSKDYAPPASNEISYMFLCKILIGNPGKYGSGHAIKMDIHDSSSDATQTIFVTPYRYGAIPQYLVAFHKTVKY